MSKNNQSRRLLGQTHDPKDIIHIPEETPSKFVVDRKSNICCFYCGKCMLATSFSSHVRQNCDAGIRKSGGDPKALKSHRKNVRNATRHKKMEDMDYRRKDYKKRHINNLKKKAPPVRMNDPVWLDLPPMHPLYWDTTTLPELGVGDVRVRVILKIKDILSNSIQDFHSVRITRNATDKDIIKRKFKSIDQLNQFLWAVTAGNPDDGDEIL